MIDLGLKGLKRKVTADHAAYTASQHVVLQGFITVAIDHMVQSSEWATYIANTAAYDKTSNVVSI